MGKPSLKKDLDIIRVMIPRGLTTAVLAQLVVMSGIPNTDIFSQIVIIVIISTVVIAGVGSSLIKRKMEKSRKIKTEINKLHE